MNKKIVVLGFIYGILAAFVVLLLFPGSFFNLSKIARDIEYVPIAKQFSEIFWESFQLLAILFSIYALFGMLFCWAICFVCNVDFGFGISVGYFFANFLILYNIALFAAFIFAGSFVGSLVSAKICIKLRLAKV